MKTITLRTKPVPLNQKYSKGRNGRLILSKRYREAKDALQWEIRSEANFERIRGGVALNIIQYFGDNRKRDIDCYLKQLLDALEGIVYENDNQVTELHVFKEKDFKDPRIVIQIV